MVIIIVMCIVVLIVLPVTTAVGCYVHWCDNRYAVDDYCLTAMFNFVFYGNFCDDCCLL